MKLAILLCLVSLLHADSAAFQEVAPGIGWFYIDGNLHWTNDDSNRWVNITPDLGADAQLSSVFFLDATQGWVLAQTNDLPTRFTLYSTSDAGRSWKKSSVPASDSALNLPGVRTSIFFVDAAHGWIQIDASRRRMTHVVCSPASERFTRLAWCPQSRLPGPEGMFALHRW